MTGAVRVYAASDGLGDLVQPGGWLILDERGAVPTVFIRGPEFDPWTEIVLVYRGTNYPDAAVHNPTNLPIVAPHLSGGESWKLVTGGPTQYLEHVLQAKNPDAAQAEALDYLRGAR